MKAIILITAVLLILASMSFARLSQPNNFYYGEAKGVGGICLTGDINAMVTAKFNGNICAETYVGGFITNRVNYILRVPLDDGWGDRFAQYAAREGEHIAVFINYDGIEFPVEEEIQAIGPPASSFETDIQATPEPCLFIIYCLLFIIYYLKYCLPNSPLERGGRGGDGVC